MNNVSLIGRLTKSIALKKTESGITIARFTVAVQRNYKNKQTGEYEADFINCIAFNKAAETLAKYTDKGYRVGITGKLQTSSYLNNDERRYSTDIIVGGFNFLDFKKEQQSGSNHTNTHKPENKGYEYDGVNQGFNLDNHQFDFEGNDLPF